MKDEKKTFKNYTIDGNTIEWAGDNTVKTGDFKNIDQMSSTQRIGYTIGYNIAKIWSKVKAKTDPVLFPTPKTTNKLHDGRLVASLVTGFASTFLGLSAAGTEEIMTRTVGWDTATSNQIDKMLWPALIGLLSSVYFFIRRNNQINQFRRENKSNQQG